MITTEVKNVLQIGQLVEFAFKLIQDIKTYPQDKKYCFYDNDEVILACVFVNENGINIQQSDGIGGLLDPVILGESGLSVWKQTGVTESIVFEGIAGTNGGSVLIKGNNSAPSLDSSEQGPGTRMLFYTKKAAFRAGTVFDDQWDDSNIGFASTAFGASNIVSGDFGFSAGYYNEVNDDYGTTLGAFCTAGLGGFAQGWSCDAGQYSIAMGSQCTASDYYALAIGDRCYAYYGGIAMGDRSEANGYNGIAIGSVCQASGPHSFSVGARTNANGIYSASIGWEVNANSASEIALGSRNIRIGGNPNSFVLTDKALSIGNGNPFLLGDSNALTLTKDGKMAIRQYNLTGGTFAANGSIDQTAILDLQSNNSGFLLPRMTSAQINAISLPTNGLQIYNIDTNEMNYYNGTQWRKLTSTPA